MGGPLECTRYSHYWRLTGRDAASTLELFSPLDIRRSQLNSLQRLFVFYNVLLFNAKTSIKYTVVSAIFYLCHVWRVPSWRAPVSFFTAARPRGRLFAPPRSAASVSARTSERAPIGVAPLGLAVALLGAPRSPALLGGRRRRTPWLGPRRIPSALLLFLLAFILVPLRCMRRRRDAGVPLVPPPMARDVLPAPPVGAPCAPQPAGGGARARTHQ